jgi:hypothetical protein
VTFKDVVIPESAMYDGTCLRAMDDCGLELIPGQTTYQIYPDGWLRDYHESDAAYLNGIDPKDYGKCKYAFRLKDGSCAYELGLVPNPFGSGLVPIFDKWSIEGRKLLAAIGMNGERLKTAYARHALYAEAQAQAYAAEERVLEDGLIEITMTGYCDVEVGATGWS